MLLSKYFEDNLQKIEDRLKDCSDVVHRQMMIAEVPIYVVYMDSMIDRELIEGELLRDMMYGIKELPAKSRAEYLQNHVISTADSKLMDDLEDVLVEALSGNTVLLVEGSRSALVISSKKFPMRGVQAAESEVAVRGPKDSFTESMRFNTVLIRRRIRDTRLKSIQKKIGERSKTDVAIMYMDGIARPELIREIQNRLDAFKIDGIFDCGSVEQLTEKKWYSPFPQFQTTERPDKRAY